MCCQSAARGSRLGTAHTVSLTLLSLCEGSSHHEAAAATSNSRQCALSSTQMCALGSHTVPMHVRARSCAMWPLTAHTQISAATLPRAPKK